MPPGNYLITAKAFDTNNNSNISAPTKISVANTTSYLQHNLVSDLPGLADFVDTNLLNPWGIAFGGTTPFWIADNHSGFSTIYDTTGALQSLVVTVPPPVGGNPPSAPTGVIYNNTSNFLVVSNLPARFIFATEDGTLSAWESGTGAMLKVDNSSSNAIYKGLAIGNLGGVDYLYATDFHNGKVDVFDGNFQPVAMAGAFADTNIPVGYAPFGIQNVGGELYVSYALEDADKQDDVGGLGHGYINKFTRNGNLIKRFASEGQLNSPWGMVSAPGGFGKWAGTLLVGNFADGIIHVFDETTGALLGALQDSQNNPIAIPGLWALTFGNDASGGDRDRLYFTAGIAGGGSLEDHGLFGSISAEPLLSSPIRLSDAHWLSTGGFQFTVSGLNPGATHVVEKSADLMQWTPIATNLVTGTDWNFTDTNTVNIPNRFYRVK